MYSTLPIALLSLFALAACSATGPIYKQTQDLGQDPGQGPGPAPHKNRTRRSINIFVGTRELDDGGWRPVEDQESIGIDVEFESPSAVGGEAGVVSSDDSSGNIDGSTFRRSGLDARSSGRD